LTPTIQFVRGATAAEGAFIPYSPCTPHNTKFDLVYFSHAKEATARVIKIGNMDQIHSLGIRITGNVVPTGGFNCAYPLGASSGVSGGIQLSNGSVHITPPQILGNQWDVDDLSGWTGGVSPMLTNRAVVYLGMVGSEGLTAATTITDLYAETGVTNGVPMEYTVLGNFNATNVYMNQGTLSLSEDINPESIVTVNNLYMNNTSVLDLANAPDHSGLVTVSIKSNSNATTVKPNSQTTMNIGNLRAQLNESKFVSVAQN
jgi:hypothetical protein